METYEYVYGENSGIEKRTDDAGVSREVIGWSMGLVPLQVCINVYKCRWFDPCFFGLVGLLF